MSWEVKCRCGIKGEYTYEDTARHVAWAHRKAWGHRSVRFQWKERGAGVLVVVRAPGQDFN